MYLRLENTLAPEAVAEVRRIVAAARFVDGTVSGRADLKKNLQAERSTPEFDRAIKKVIAALMRREDFKTYAAPKQITLEFNRYDPGMYYRDHMDSALMGGVRAQPMRADLSFTVFLTDPAEYRGGEFVLRTAFGEHRIKEPAGNAIVYPSTMLHRVEPIEDGTRWAAIGWIQSMLRSESQREIVYEIRQLRDSVLAVADDAALRERFDRLQSNLVRLWAEV